MMTTYKQIIAYRWSLLRGAFDVGNDEFLSKHVEGAVMIPVVMDMRDGNTKNTKRSSVISKALLLFVSAAGCSSPRLFRGLMGLHNKDLRRE